MRTSWKEKKKRNLYCIHVRTQYRYTREEKRRMLVFGAFGAAAAKSRSKGSATHKTKKTFGRTELWRNFGVSELGAYTIL